MIDSRHDTSTSVANSAKAANEDLFLAEVRELAQKKNLPFAGSITPQDAWRLIESGAATLVDVRTLEERKFVGHVPTGLHVAWMTGISMNRNPRFVKEVETKIADKSSIIVLLCRSGKRSAAAGEALTNAGFVNVFNIDEGFEGDLNEENQRGHLGGWRYRSLPWVQD